MKTTFLFDDFCLIYQVESGIDWPFVPSWTTQQQQQRSNFCTCIAQHTGQSETPTQAEASTESQDGITGSKGSSLVLNKCFSQDESVAILFISTSLPKFLCQPLRLWRRQVLWSWNAKVAWHLENHIRASSHAQPHKVVFWLYSDCIAHTHTRLGCQADRCQCVLGLVP